MNRLLLFFLVLSSISCSKTFSNEREYLHYINVEENGLKTSRIVGEIEMTAKYLSPEFLALKEARLNGLNNKAGKDSIIRHYNNSYTFLFTIGYRKDLDQDLLKGSSENYEEYKELVQEMNFNMEDYFRLVVNSDTISPALAKLEDSYGLKDERNVYVVFPRKADNTDPLNDKIRFTYRDYLFESGITHFYFEKKKLLETPQFAF